VPKHATEQRRREIECSRRDLATSALATNSSGMSPDPVPRRHPLSPRHLPPVISRGVVPSGVGIPSSVVEAAFAPPPTAMLGPSGSVGRLGLSQCVTPVGWSRFSGPGAFAAAAHGAEAGGGTNQHSGTRAPWPVSTMDSKSESQRVVQRVSSSSITSRIERGGDAFAKQCAFGTEWAQSTDGGIAARRHQGQVPGSSCALRKLECG